MYQTSMPGTDRVIATYSCGHGRDHSIPSDRVRIYKWGTGHVVVCDCDGYDIETAHERPHQLGDNTVMLSLPDDSPALWLALDGEADGWWDYNDGEGYDEGVGADDPAPKEKRAERREECRDEVEA